MGQPTYSTCPVSLAATGVGRSQFANRERGWVAEMSGLAAKGAHALEKSATSFGDTSIHRLYRWAKVSVRYVRVALGHGTGSV
jgi:hypothetical protein